MFFSTKWKELIDHCYYSVASNASECKESVFLQNLDLHSSYCVVQVGYLLFFFPY